MSGQLRLGWQLVPKVNGGVSSLRQLPQPASACVEILEQELGFRGRFLTSKLASKVARGLSEVSDGWSTLQANSRLRVRQAPADRLGKIGEQQLQQVLELATNLSPLLAWIERSAFAGKDYSLGSSAAAFAGKDCLLGSTDAWKCRGSRTKRQALPTFIRWMPR